MTQIAWITHTARNIIVRNNGEAAATLSGGGGDWGGGTLYGRPAGVVPRTNGACPLDKSPGGLSSRGRGRARARRVLLVDARATAAARTPAYSFWTHAR